MNYCFGMFAFALYDKANNQLTLARDRIGEKPIYYGWLDNDFVFASEINALKQHHKWKNNISNKALKNYFKYNYVPNPLSIYENIYKLEPNTFISLTEENQQWTITNKINWDKYLFSSQDKKIHIYSDLLDYTNLKLTEVINQQSRADVSVGCFLSGGIDSSLVSSVMQANNMNKINTFTIGYNEDLYDESTEAELIAKHIGTNHCKITLSPLDAMNIIPQLSEIYDEPFADASQIPTSIISKFTKKHVKVALSGDGGDELFGGYNRYIWGTSFNNDYKFIPKKLKKIIKYLLLALPPQSYNKYFKLLKIYLEKILILIILVKKLLKLQIYLILIMKKKNIIK